MDSGLTEIHIKNESEPVLAVGILYGFGVEIGSKSVLLSQSEIRMDLIRILQTNSVLVTNDSWELIFFGFTVHVRFALVD